MSSKGSSKLDGTEPFNLVASEIERIWRQPMNQQAWLQPGDGILLMMLNKLYSKSILREAAKQLACKHPGVAFTPVRRPYTNCPFSAVVICREAFIPNRPPKSMELVRTASRTPL